MRVEIIDKLHKLFRLAYLLLLILILCILCKIQTIPSFRLLLFDIVFPVVLPNQHCIFNTLNYFLYHLSAFCNTGLRCSKLSDLSQAIVYKLVNAERIPVDWFSSWLQVLIKFLNPVLKQFFLDFLQVAYCFIIFT